MKFAEAIAALEERKKHIEWEDGSGHGPLDDRIDYARKDIEAKKVLLQALLDARKQRDAEKAKLDEAIAFLKLAEGMGVGRPMKEGVREDRNGKAEAAIAARIE